MWSGFNHGLYFSGWEGSETATPLKFLPNSYSRRRSKELGAMFEVHTSDQALDVALTSIFTVDKGQSPVKAGRTSKMSKLWDTKGLGAYTTAIARMTRGVSKLLGNAEANQAEVSSWVGTLSPCPKPVVAKAMDALFSIMLTPDDIDVEAVGVDEDATANQ